MTELGNLILRYWPETAAAINVTLNLIVSGHAVLYKRDTRAAIAGVGVIWLAPVVGVMLYFVLGINRISRRAQRLVGGLREPQSLAGSPADPDEELQPGLGNATHLA